MIGRPVIVVSLAGVCLLSPQVATLTQHGTCSQSAIAANQTVTANSSLQFTPASVTLAPGEMVTWNNTGGSHNVHFDDNSFVQPPSPQLAPWTVSRTFTTPGTFKYYCDAHGQPNGVGMSGTVTVAVPHEHPVGASPVRVPLVPAFGACTAPNSTHGAPLNFPSCNPPTPASSTVRAGGGSIGSAWVIVCNTGAAVPACNESSPGFTASMQPDVRIFGSARDVQCRLTGTPTGCSAGSDYNPNGTSGPYTSMCKTAAACGSDGRPSPFCAPGGSSSSTCIAGTDVTLSAGLGQASAVTVNPSAQCGSNATCVAFASKFVGHGLRLTDSYNCDPSLPPGNPDACPASSSATRGATMVDVKFPVPLDCIVNPEGAISGSNCGVNTTTNALVPGFVLAGKLAVVELGEVQLLDSGPDGVRGSSDDQRFATQGIYLP